jgi:hypothetical protein
MNIENPDLFCSSSFTGIVFGLGIFLDYPGYFVFSDQIITFQRSGHLFIGCNYCQEAFFIDSTNGKSIFQKRSVFFSDRKLKS